MGTRILTIAVILIGAVVLLAPACGDDDAPDRTTASGRTAAAAPTGLGPPAERVLLGRIASLKPAADGYEMRFDPSLLLSGETANVAAAEDGVVAPGEPVPNDNYEVDESDRLFTYLVPDDASVSVLTRTADGFGLTTVTVEELAAVVAGTSDIELFEPLDTGVWITVDIDTVRRIVHQYTP
jgi:hypothetical protein